ncbi:major facilitator superfamily domain-containing protein [Talaromyces proteolyticus]|uniref:Major facilitator superfamily domain-containing protein n=1 Tax=Talaromyces proteolyticus TaxID=1131652 RepID=A0AAD4KQF6_9EURO|nr:major facilitator superfamily domain-containing protein [Talaromyces proteolyticus]KAH8697988.1 major facilitator superfamily domain-containing protein [Talaromyces proteolyticus]
MLIKNHQIRKGSQTHQYQAGAFETREGHRHYRPIDSYKGLHRWDPEFELTEEEEKKIVKKIDVRVLTFARLTFFALQLDRGNIGQALSSTFLQNLNMTSNDYNLSQTVFYICFLLSEMPSQLLSKRIGPDRRGAYLALRALLGIIEGGFIPDTILFLSFFYKYGELPKRLTWFWISYIIAGIIGAFMAFGLLHITGSHGGSWRYLSAHEGLVTGVIGIIAGFWMPASPVQTKGWLREKHGWFTEHEEKIVVIESFETTLAREVFTTFETNLLVIPSSIIGILTMAAITWCLVLLMALEFLPERSMPWQRWIVFTLIVGTPSIHPVVTRIVATALYYMSVQLSSIASSNVIKDAPYYRHGNKVLIALAVVSMTLFVFAKLFYDFFWNRKNAAIWDAMTSEQREIYLRENPGLKNKRLDFRFAV